MNKEAIGIGSIVMVAIAVIVGAILIQSSAQNVGEVVNTVSVSNQSFDVPVNLTASYITDCRAISGLVAKNKTNGITVLSGNYTITNNVLYNSNLATKIVVDANAGVGNPWDWNLTYTCQPLTYDDSSGNRAVASLIIILMGFAIVSVVIVHAVKSYMD